MAYNSFQNTIQFEFHSGIMIEDTSVTFDVEVIKIGEAEYIFSVSLAFEIRKLELLYALVLTAVSWMTLFL